MLNIRISKRARDNIADIKNHIFTDNRHAAKDLEKDILAAISFLAEHPLSGRERPEFTNKPFRFWVVRKNYVIIYSIEQNNLKIHAVLHTARDIAILL